MTASLSSVRLAADRPYPAYLNLIPILSGLIDPLCGVFAEVSSIFQRPRLPARLDSPRRRRRGLTLILGGIEGPSRYSRAMACGLYRSRYRGAVIRFPWNRGVPGLRSLVNLMDRRHHERQSDALVQTIVDHRRRFPASPVCLLAQSGGCWIVLRSLEKLPEGVSVQTAVLLAPSISPAYDVSRATARCTDALISIGGPGDMMFLGLGTTIFGSSDRVHTPSAGWIGWHHHPPGFIETRWHPDWVRHGYLGNHTSSGAVRFIQRIVGPRLRTPLAAGRAAVAAGHARA